MGCRGQFLSSLVSQNAQCVAFFPAMLPLPGYFPASATQFSICVPPSACPGVDVSAVRAILKDLDLGASGAAIDDSAIGPVMAQFFMYHSLTNGSDSGLVSVGTSVSPL